MTPSDHSPRDPTNPQTRPTHAASPTAREPVTKAPASPQTPARQFGDKIPTEAGAGQHLTPLYDMAQWLGKPGALAAGVFLAYLMGCVLEISAQTLNFGVRIIASKPLVGRFITILDDGCPRLYRWLFQGLSALSGSLNESTTIRIHRYSEERIARALRRPPTDQEMGAHSGQAFVHLMSDLPQLPTRLYTASKDMYGDYDRLVAEADLRVNVGLAGMFLSCVMAAQVHVLWALLIMPMVVLLYRGIGTLRKANTILVQAIVADLVKSPRFEEYISELGPAKSDHRDPGYR